MNKSHITHRQSHWKIPFQREYFRQEYQKFARSSIYYRRLQNRDTIQTLGMSFLQCIYYTLQHIPISLYFLVLRKAAKLVKKTHLNYKEDLYCLQISR